MMTIKYGLHFFFFELTDNDGQNFLSAIVRSFSHCRPGSLQGEQHIHVKMAGTRTPTCPYTGMVTTDKI
jgi:hypothetical protein